MQNAGNEILETLLSLQNQIERRGGRQFGEDLFQEVCLKVFQKDYRDHESLHKLIYRITKTCLIDRRRKERIRRHLPLIPDLDLEASGDDPPCELERKERNEALEGAIERLDSNKREIVKLSLYSVLNNQQISHKLNRKFETIRGHRWRATNELKVLLEAFRE